MHCPIQCQMDEDWGRAPFRASYVVKIVSTRGHFRVMILTSPFLVDVSSTSRRSGKQNWRLQALEAQPPKLSFTSSISSVGLVVLAANGQPFEDPFVRLEACSLSRDTATTAVTAVM
jgi:hypothetical protein